jgi:hypothetical protein
VLTEVEPGGATKKKKGSRSSGDAGMDISSGEENDFDEQEGVMQAMAISAVQAQINRNKTAAATNKEKELRERYNRSARAKIGTYDKLTWHQMNPEDAKGQRQEVHIITREIQDKTRMFPTSPVSAVCVFDDNHFGNVLEFV